MCSRSKRRVGTPPKSTGRYQKYPNMMFFKVYLLSNIWLHFGALHISFSGVDFVDFSPNAACQDLFVDLLCMDMDPFLRKDWNS